MDMRYFTCCNHGLDLLTSLCNDVKTINKLITRTNWPEIMLIVMVAFVALDEQE